MNCPLSKHAAPRPPPPSAQGGVALVIALILLVVLAFGSVVAARTAVSGDLVSKNIRSHNLALQAAEIALRFCEQQIAINPAALNLLVLNNPATDNEWQTAANWANNLNVVPAATLSNTVNYNQAPECLVRRLSYDELYGGAVMPPDAVRPEDRGITTDFLFFFRITARGYSPDYTEDGAGLPLSGAEVWLQSMVRTVL